MGGGLGPDLSSVPVLEFRVRLLVVEGVGCPDLQLGGIHRILGQVGKRENLDLPGALLQLVRSDGRLIQSVLKLRMRLRRRRCNLFFLLLISRPCVQRRQFDDLETAW